MNFASPTQSELSDNPLNAWSKEALIAEVHRLRHALEEAEQDKQRFIDASYDGYWDWYIQDDYEYMSPRFWEIFGFDPREKKHHPSEWQSLVFPDDLQVALANFHQHMVSKGRHPYVQEVRYRHHNGSTVTVLCRGQVTIWDKDGKPLRMIGTHMDITSLKAKERELEFKTAELKRSNAELEQFAYVASHDLQTPLRHISTYVQLLADRHESTRSDEEKRWMAYILKGCERMKGLIDDLLTFSRVGRGRLNVKTFDLGEVVSEVLETLQFEIVKVRAEIDVQPLPMVYGDASLLVQLLQNVIENALKFRKPDTTPVIRIDSDVNQTGDVKVCVSDNGIGIAAKHTERVFHIFQRLHRQEDYPGTGIGLSICRKIVMMHGGEIGVESIPDQGTCFWFTLPRPD